MDSTVVWSLSFSLCFSFLSVKRHTSYGIISSFYVLFWHKHVIEIKINKNWTQCQSVDFSGKILVFPKGQKSGCLNAMCWWVTKYTREWARVCIFTNFLRNPLLLFLSLFLYFFFVSVVIAPNQMKPYYVSSFLLVAFYWMCIF